MSSCRMFLLVGKNRKVHRALIDALRRAAREDPYLRSVGSTGSHDDGWGRVAVGLKDGKVFVSEYRTLRPIFLEPEEVLYTEHINNFIIDLVHARKASRDMALNLISTQPIRWVSSSGAEVYVAHNGTLDKGELLKEVSKRRNVPKELSEACSDTCLLAMYLSDVFKNSIDIGVVETLKNMTKTALNLIVLLVKDKYVEVLFGSYYRKEEHKDYYKMYFTELGGGFAVASSTLVDLYLPEGIAEWKEMENGRYYKAVVDLIGKRISWTSPPTF